MPFVGGEWFVASGRRAIDTWIREMLMVPSAIDSVARTSRELRVAQLALSPALYALTRSFVALPSEENSRAKVFWWVFPLSDRSLTHA